MAGKPGGYPHTGDLTSQMRFRQLPAGHLQRRHMRSSPLVTLAAMAVFSAPLGCKDEPARSPAPAAAVVKVDVVTAKRAAKPKRIWLVPHPSEIQQVLKVMGIADQAGPWVPLVEVDFAPMDGQRAAFNTG